MSIFTGTEPSTDQERAAGDFGLAKAPRDEKTWLSHKRSVITDPHLKAVHQKFHGKI